ncbi:hypothetical protein C0J45_7740, partial [Silurus meridionalis]
PCACGSTILAKDSHPLCIVCLGVRHAQTVLANPECCPHCALFPSRVRERRLRVAAANKRDPCLSPLPAERDEAASQAQCSWGEFMDEVSPVLPSVFESHSLLDNKGVEEEDDEVAHFLEEDLEDDEEDAILPPDLLSRPGTKKHSIEWPSQQVHSDAERDLYEGKKLPSRTSPVKQLIPAVPACVTEMCCFWDKPFSHRVPVKGFSRLEVHDMEALGMYNPPPVELSVASHLHPNRRAALSSSSPSLPGRTEMLSASLFQKNYCSSALAVRALNATFMLTTYQAELMEEIGRQIDAGSPDSTLWEEICVIADLNLRSSRGAVQSCGRSMGLAVVGERALWLGLTGLSEREKVDFLDAPIEPKALFGAAVANMRQQCDLRKKDGEAFEACLPRKPPARPPQPARSYFAPASRERQPGFRAPRQPPPQQSMRGEARQKQPQPRNKTSFAEAAARHRPADPQGGKKR